MLLQLRDAGELDDQLLRAVQLQLDLEDALLTQAMSESEERSGLLEELIPAAPSTCDHLAAAPSPPRAADDGLGCEECVVLGWERVHLKQCLTCGRVGCCDSSRGRHAAIHFDTLAHPVMRSAEPGETWRWCYIDRVPG
ncbi:MAG: UBP-type zinc finger domain-containing protein [Acidimicrobiales bacterium]